MLAADFLRSRVYFAELHKLVVIFAACLAYHCALMADILGLRSLKVTTVAHLAHETEPLRAAGEAAYERSGTLVLSALNLNSRVCIHDFGTLAHQGHFRQKQKARGERALRGRQSETR